MPTLAEALIAIIQYAPQAINEATALYHAVKADLSETDQAQIDSALLAAQDDDAEATKAADAALDEASKS